MRGESRLKIRVRHSELDAFGHVNNAVYFSYFEEARWKLLEETGWTLARLFEEGLGIVLKDCSVKFLRPLPAGDEIEIVTSTQKVRASSVVWRQEIIRAGERVAEAEFSGVFVSAGTFRPVRIPEEIRASMEQ